MTFEEFGFSKEEQLEIRRDAVLGALNDEFGPIEEFSEGDINTVDERGTETIQDLGVSKKGALIIVAEQEMIFRKGNIGE